MRSAIGHPVLDYFRVLDTRARSAEMRRRLQGVTQLPLTQLDNAALATIAADPAPTVTDLAATMGVSVARASRHAARLEQLGLAVKSRAAEDARATVVSLTDAGRRVRELWRTGWTTDYATVLAGLEPARRAGLAADVGRLHRALAQAWPHRSRQPRPPAADGEHGELETLTSFAQWAGPAITHPSYARAVIERIGAPLSPQSLLLLRAIGAYGPADITTLAERGGIDASTVSRLVAALADERLAERTANPADARATLVRLTAAGRHTLLAAEAVELETITRAVRSWDGAAVDACMTSVAVLVSGLERPTAPPTSE